MALLTVAELEEHIETDLPITALDRLIADAEQEIVQRFGEHATQTDRTYGGFHLLVLSRPADSITSATEIIGETTYNLVADDYELWPDKVRLKRLTTGTNPRSAWGDVVEVSYAPVDETAKRKRVMIDVIKLAIEHRGLASEKVGDYSMSAVDYERERSRILNRLGRLTLV